MPRGRRPVLQLKSPVGGTSYLARSGCYSNSGDASSQNQNKDGNRVTNLVGDYPDSDTENEDVPPTPPAAPPIPVPDLPDIPMPPSTKPSEQSDSRIDPVIDDEVAHFLAEIDAISSVPAEDGATNQKPSSSHSDSKDGVAVMSSGPSEEFVPASEVNSFSNRKDTDSPQLSERDAKCKAMFVLGQTAEKDSKYKSMFVQGQSEFSGKDKSDVSETNSSSSHLKYKSMFVKGQSEFVNKEEKTVAVDVVKKPSENSAETSDEELPEEPVSLWQQCLDEHTQFHYYWHTLTNEVTWEIPPEYTQYLLLYKEYEERIARIPPEKLAKLKEKKLKSEKTETKQRPAEDPKSKSVCKPSDDVSMDSTVSEGKEHTESSRTKSKHKSHSTDKSEKTETKHVSQTSVNDKVKSERTDSKVDSSSEHKSSKSSKHKHKHKSRDRDSKHGSKEKTSVTEKTDVDKASDSNADVTTADDDVDVDFDIDDIDRALELALERKRAELQRLEDQDTTPVTKNTESQLKRSSSPDKTNSSQVSTPPSPKRQKLVAYGADEDDSETEQDSQSEKGTSVSSEMSQDKLPLVPSLVKIKDEVEDQANIALGKLEFLEVTKKGLSRLQVLLLELQTRFRDWQDGGLNTDYFLERLAEANSQLKQYEQSAVPHGWSCHWDRNFRRYFYTNMTTGESRWDYPDIEMTVPPPPPPPHPKDSDEGDQPVSCSSVNKPDSADLLAKVTVPLAEVSTTTSDPHRIPDTSSKVENVFEGPQLPDSMAVLTEVHPEEPPPPGFDNPPTTGSQLSSTQDPETEPATATLDAAASIDGMPYSPDSSDDIKDDFDIDQMLESTVISMAAENRQKNATISMATEDYSVNSPMAAEGYPKSSAVSVTAVGYPSVSMTTESCQKNAGVAMATEGSHLSAAVIYQPPKTNVVGGSSAIATVQPPVPYPPLGDQPALPSPSPVNSPVPAPAHDDEPSSSAQEEVEKRERKKKKKDKEKKISSTSLTYKKKNVSSLVQKWHQVKVQVEQEEKLNEERQMAIRQKLEEWKQSHS